jgi:serine/threonine protein phosphatase PrpC
MMAVSVQGDDPPDPRRPSAGIVCPSCGRLAAPEHSFCEACRTALVPALASDGAGGPATRCPYCPAGRIGTDGYCESCGRRAPAGRDHTELDLSLVAGVTDRGLRHRRNEDAMVLATAHGPSGDPVVVAVVCDGVSSADRPDEASLAAAQAAADVLLAAARGGDDLAAASGQAVQAAQLALARLAGLVDDRPTEDLPVQDAPPTEDLPVLDAPPTEDLTALDAPPTEVLPAVDASFLHMSAGDPPAGDLHAKDALPTEFLPTVGAPIRYMSATDTPTEDLPALDASTRDIPARDTPAARPPAGDTSADDDAAGNAPAATFVSAVLTADTATLCWLGDSRAYWLGDGDGATARRLTRDDSLAEEMVAAGLLDEAEALAVPQAHVVTRWVGADLAGEAAHVVRFEPPGTGVLLLCSDGLWNYAPGAADLAARALPRALTDPLAAAADLVAFALGAGGHDNVTAVLAPFHPRRRLDPAHHPHRVITANSDRDVELADTPVDSRKSQQRGHQLIIEWTTQLDTGHHAD